MGAQTMEAGLGKLLILGAGRGQLGLILAAQRLGIETFVATLPTGQHASAVPADHLVHVDITNPSLVIEAARRHGVSAVATSCSDRAIPVLGAVCEALGLVGLTSLAANASSDKRLMKAAFLQGGVQTAIYHIVASRSDFGKAISRIGYPLIVKPVDCQGSAGVTILHDAQHADRAYLHARRASRVDEVIVESFLEGTEFGAQALVRNGEIVFVLPHGDETFMAKTAVPVGHYVPLDQSTSVIKDAIYQTSQAIRALGLDNCAVNVDLILHDRKVFVIEIAGRAGANGLPELVSRHLGLDYYECILRLALGREVFSASIIEESRRPAAAVRMIIAPNRAGRLGLLTIDHTAAPEAEYAMFLGTGDVVNGFQSSADCIGQLVVSGQSLEIALAAADLAQGAVVLELVEHA